MAKVLYIDNRTGPREKVLGPLRSIGHEIFEADSGEEGLACLQKNNPDLVLCRADLPQMTGISLIEQAQLQSGCDGKTQFILLSDDEDPAARLHDIELGADDSLTIGDDFDAVSTLILGRLRLVDRLTKQRERELVRLYNVLAKQPPKSAAAPQEDAGLKRLADFALMSADILLEMDHEQRVHFAAVGGAAVACEPFNAHPGGPFGMFIETAAAARLSVQLRGLKPGARIAALPCEIAGSEAVFIARATRQADGEDRTRITFTRQNPQAEKAASDIGRDETSGLADKDAFTRIAGERLKAAREGNSQAELTLLDVPGLAKLCDQDEDPAATQLLGEIGAYLRSQSDGGDAAGLLEADRFGLVHSGGITTDGLQKTIAGMISAVGLDQKGVSASASNVALTGNTLSEEQALQALAYAVNSFAEKGGGNFSLTSLTDSMAAYVDETVSRISNLRTDIDNNQFVLHFQPIVGLKTRDIHHYEALVRFPKGGSPFETIAFAERTGMVQELDLAICRQVIDHIRRNKRNGNPVEIAVNISACSIESSVFTALLQRLMEDLGKDRQQIIMEITESAQIRNYEEVAGIVRQLRSKGHRICLDDFGAGESNFNYLRMFEVDYVKLDGIYIKDVLRSSRDQAFIRNIVNLCKDIKVGTVAEFVEQEKQAQSLLNLGVDLGQGYLFGKPSPHLDKESELLGL